MSRALVTALLAAACAASTTATAHAASERWVGSWATALQGQYPDALMAPSTAFVGSQASDQSMRLVVRPTLGGRAVRIRLSNAFGTRPVTFGSVRVAERTEGAAIDPDSDRELTFGGRTEVTVSAGSGAVSDPANFSVKAGHDLSVSIHVKGDSGPMGWHALALATSYAGLTGAGDSTSDPTGASFGVPIHSWFFLAGVDVLAPAGAGAVVALGDSLTDGEGTEKDTNTRWPDLLARRLAPHSVGVLNQGISANALTVSTGYGGASALERFDRDVLRHTGTRAVVLLAGTNDLALSGASAEDLEAALRQLARRSHRAGLNVVAATIPPRSDSGWDVTAQEPERRRLNAWLRTAQLFDAVADIDQALRDPHVPSRMHPRYDSGDGLHPNSLGAQAIADAVPLGPLLRGRRSAASCRLRRIHARVGPAGRRCRWKGVAPVRTLTGRGVSTRTQRLVSRGRRLRPALGPAASL